MIRQLAVNKGTGMQLVQNVRGLARPRTLLGIALLLVVAGIAAFVLLRGNQNTPARNYSLVTPRIDTLVASVSAAGQIEPDQTVNLSLTGTGRVDQVLVAVGDHVREGQVLARLDQRELQLRVTQAEAALTQARASYQKLSAGATEHDIQAAQAQLDQARAQLLQIQGGVTPADLAAAQAQLQQAQTALTRLTGGPQQSDLDSANARVRDAELSLQSQRNQLSQAKTNARIQLDQATNALTQAQSRYSTAKQNWDYVQETGADPIVRRVSDPSKPGQTKPNTLNDSQRQQYYDTIVQAESALRTAENNLTQAQVAYDQTQQAEQLGIERAEGQLAVSQGERAQLVAGADVNQLAAARAQLASAKANVAKLGGDQRNGALQAAQAAVALAENRLAQLRDGPLPADLAAAQAQVDNAQAALDLAKLALDSATLTAPFAGEIAEVNLKVGELPSLTRPAITLTNLASLHVTVTVDEVDIPRIAAAQLVTLTLDALPGAILGGKVESVAPLALTPSTVTSYQVRIAIVGSDPRVRPGMSTNADIVVARRDQVLLLPRRALHSDRGRLLVDLANDPSLCTQPLERLPARPPTTAREVQIGLSNDQSIEITNGVGLKECVYVEGIDARVNPLAGPPPGVRNR
jgi:HlyD family secretion protein